MITVLSCTRIWPATGTFILPCMILVVQQELVTRFNGTLKRNTRPVHNGKLFLKLYVHSFNRKGFITTKKVMAMLPIFFGFCIKTSVPHKRSMFLMLCTRLGIYIYCSKGYNRYNKVISAAPSALL